jgi:hypothetical protein
MCCHPERSEGSTSMGPEMLSAAKHDRTGCVNAMRLIKDELRLTGRLFHLRSLCGIVEEEALTGDAAAPR